MITFNSRFEEPKCPTSGGVDITFENISFRSKLFSPRLGDLVAFKLFFFEMTKAFDN